MQPKSLNTSKRKMGENKWQIGFNLDALLNFGIVELEIPTEHKQNIPAPKKKQNTKKKQTTKEETKHNRGKWRVGMQKYCDMNQSCVTGWCICANMHYCDYCDSTGDDLSTACVDAIEEMAKDLKFHIDYNNRHDYGQILKKLESLAEKKFKNYEK